MRENSSGLKDLMPIIKERLAAGESVTFTPNGVSMRPTIVGGRDKVTLSPLPEKIKKYDMVLYQRESGQYVLHRVAKVGDTYTFIGDNQFYFEPGVRYDQMIAIANEFIHKGKKHSVDEPLYKAYCRVWLFFRPIRLFIARVVRKTKNILKIK